MTEEHRDTDSMWEQISRSVIHADCTYIHSAATSTGEDSQQECSAQLAHISLNIPNYCRESRSETKRFRKLLISEVRKFCMVYPG